MNRNTPNESISFWLVPAEPEKDLFTNLIKTLARELKAPVFPPHLTLFITRLRIAEARRLLRDFTSGPLSLTVAGVDHSDRFTKTLFIRFRPGAALARLTKALQLRAGTRVKPVTDPHLSLCYMKLTASSRRELASFIRMPFPSVSFDRVTLALCGSQTRSAADVKAWRTISSVPLGD